MIICHFISKQGKLSPKISPAVFGKTQESISLPICSTFNPFKHINLKKPCVAISQCSPNWGTHPSPTIGTDVLAAGAQDPAFPKLKLISPFLSSHNLKHSYFIYVVHFMKHY